MRLNHTEPTAVFTLTGAPIVQPPLVKPGITGRHIFSKKLLLSFPFFVILDILPAPPCIPQIRPLADLFLHLPVTLFNGAIELVPIAINLQGIIIGEFSPVLLKMSLELVPTLFELLVVHDALLCFLKRNNPVATLVILSSPRRRLGRVLGRKPQEGMPD